MMALGLMLARRWCVNQRLFAVAYSRYHKGARIMTGETLSHYLVLERIGSGGMGIVYKARDTRLQRYVALKVLSDEMSRDPNALERFRREAQNASALNHPHICTIYEVDVFQGKQFIAMELLEGETLKDRIANGPLATEEVLVLGLQIAEALGVAHSTGIIHRDIKPANIFITKHGQAKVLDFGLAKSQLPLETNQNTLSMAVQALLTTPGTALGTVAYMSPEQTRGEAPDARSDLFSFGAVLYEMVTGNQAFSAPTVALIYDAILNRPPTPSTIPVPVELNRILDKLLQKEQAKRYPTAAEVHGDLERLHLDMSSARRSSLTSLQRAPDKSVAVLYLENLGGAKEDDALRDSITEEVIIELSKVKDLCVFSRSTVLAFRDKPVSASAVGKQLGAAYVLEGGVRRGGDWLRVSVQFVETTTGRSIWAERYDRKPDDSFAVQDELAQNIARALSVVLSGDEKHRIQRTRTSNVRAYDYYLRGRNYFDKHFGGPGLFLARQMFTCAIEVDPAYAHAYAGLADCNAFLFMYHDKSEVNLKLAEEFSRKALDLDPELAEAHVARGNAVALRKDLEASEKEYQNAIRLDPSLFEAYYFYGRALRSLGRMVEAVELFRQAALVRPEDYQSRVALGACYAALGRVADSLAAYRQASEAAQSHLEVNPDDARAIYMGAIAWCRLGETERGHEWARRALSLNAGDPHICYNVACAYALLGKSDQAIELLGRAFALGPSFKEWAKTDPDLNSLRGDARFQLLTVPES
jgi:serine/threonine protein kinase/tetratricopeptide (TPR) repeat protein